MAALRSVEPEERGDVIAELRKTIEDRERYQHHLARLTAAGAPKSYLGKLRAQIAACERHEARFRRMLNEVAA
jgi:N-methylhydantoinase B/oxoprolinase/acetone carboxylase alpha subunit